MNILMINLGNYGSTGNLMIDVADGADKAGHKVYISCPASRVDYKRPCDNQIFIGTRIGRNIHLVLGKVTGFHGMFSFLDTMVFLKKIKKLNIDLVHIHNLHGDYINLPLFFWFLRKNGVKVVWTMHDCWGFTGRCAHYSMKKCLEWRSGCYRCKYRHLYPKVFWDHSKLFWKLKKKWINGIKDLIITTPSEWLKDQAKHSFLKEQRIEIVNNWVDLDQFKPMESNFRSLHNIADGQVMILGVSSIWRYEKGLDVFIHLSKILSPRYKIVLVGEIGKDKIPSEIITVEPTCDRNELCEIYTAADVLLNPTREEVFGLVNVESLACGTPVITFDSGGSPECVDETCGSVVPVGDLGQLMMELRSIQKYRKEACIKRAKKFDKNHGVRKILEIYSNLMYEKDR